MLGNFDMSGYFNFGCYVHSSGINYYVSEYVLLACSTHSTNATVLKAFVGLLAYCESGLYCFGPSRSAMLKLSSGTLVSLQLSPIGSKGS